MVLEDRAGLHARTPLADHRRWFSEARRGVLFIAEPSPQFVANSGVSLVIWNGDDFGLLGMWTGRQEWREHLIFYALFATFAAVTAIFYGHTSYRVYLDVYWIVFAANLLELFWNKFHPTAGQQAVSLGFHQG